MEFATSNGSATAGSDYTAASGILTFPQGTTSQNIKVPVLTDTATEVDETFTLSNPTGALGNATATGTIQDTEATADTPDDPPALHCQAKP